MDVTQTKWFWNIDYWIGIAAVMVIQSFIVQKKYKNVYKFLLHGVVECFLI